MGWSVLRLAVLGILAVTAAEAQQKTTVAHAIAMHGQPKYGPDFKHFDYVDPNAPKGGSVRLGVRGTFDNFNRFIPKGVAGAGDATETLLTSSADEPFTQYGLIAESLEWPEDRSWVVFTLRPEARWHDGKPITVEDVIFSLDILKTKGRPFYRFYYASIKKSEKVGPRKVKFTFAEAGNRELPLIAGQIPILPKHYWEGEGRDFTKTTLEPPLGSGPYRITGSEPGRHIVVERVKDYWGAHLPVRRGRSNFNSLRYEYYFDETVLRQALKAGKLDYREENQAKAWALDYDTPAVRDGRLKLEKIGHQNPTGMQAFVMNSRRQVFKDRKLRRALAYAFDFEWSNRNLFFSQYTRTESYFSNSDLASTGLPKGEELAVLEGYRGRVPDEVFNQVYKAPKTDGSGWPRDNLSRAFALLAEAGWVVRNMKLVNAETGKRLKFEILLYSTTFERVVLPFKRNLTRLGIDARVRLVDTSQYTNRMREFDFDIVVGGWGQSESPGNEQRGYWSSAAAASPAAQNLIGIKDPVVDELIELVISAPSRQSLVNRTRALDRVLLWGHYVIPNWHVRVDRIASWDKFSRPAITPRHGTNLDYWWFDAAKDAALKDRQVVQSTDEEAAVGATPGVGTAIAVFLGLMVVGFVVVRQAFGRRSG
ncbi:MAG: extracellular solute-binding protein [Rhodospirillales bacterium]|nr:extracellular solute-binding protein [Rhodospirillales bacterium]